MIGNDEYNDGDDDGDDDDDNNNNNNNNNLCVANLRLYVAH